MYAGSLETDRFSSVFAISVLSDDPRGHKLQQVKRPLIGGLFSGLARLLALRA
jgi:hypothetical protein